VSLKRISILLPIAAAVASIASCRETTSIRLSVQTNVPNSPGTTVAIYASTTRDLEDGLAPQAQVESWGTDGNVGTIAVVPPSGAKGDESVNVRIVLAVGVDPSTCTLASTEKDGCIVARRKVNFVSANGLTLPVRLWARCLGQLCSATTTCSSAGTCIDSKVDGNACQESPSACSPAGEDPNAPLFGPGGADAGPNDGSPGLDGTTPTDGAVPIDGAVPGDASSDAPTDSGSSDSGSDGGNGGNDGGTVTGITPCNFPLGVDQESAWPTEGACTYRPNSTRRPGLQVVTTPTMQTFALNGTVQKVVLGRKTGGSLRFFTTGAGVRAYDFTGAAITPAWTVPAVSLPNISIGTPYTVIVHGSGVTMHGYNGDNGNEIVGYARAGWHAIPAEGGDLIFADVSPTFNNTRYTRIQSNGAEVWHVDVPGEAPDDGSTDGRITRLATGDLAVVFYLSPPKLIRGATGTFVRSYVGSPGISYCTNVTSSLRGPVHVRGDQSNSSTADLFDDVANAKVYLDLVGLNAGINPCPSYAMAPDLRSGWVRGDLMHKITMANSPTPIATSVLASSTGYFGDPQPVMDADGWLYTVKSNLTAEAYAPTGNNYTLKWSKSLAAAGNQCGTPMVADGKVFVVCSQFGLSPTLVVLSP